MMSITTVNANFLFMAVMVLVVTIGVIIPTTFASTSRNSLDDDKGTVNMMEMLRDNESSGQVNRSEIRLNAHPHFFRYNLCTHNNQIELLRSSGIDENSGEMKDCKKTILPDWNKCKGEYQHFVKELKMCDFIFNMQYCRADAACEKCDYDPAINVDKLARQVIGKLPTSKYNCPNFVSPKALDVPFCTPKAASPKEVAIVIAVVIVVGVLCISGGSAIYYFALSPAAKARSRGESGVGGPNASSSSNAYPQQQQQGPAGAYPAQQPPPPAYQQQQPQPMAYQQQQPQPMAYQQQQPMAYQQQPQPMAYQQQQQQPMAYGRP